MTAPILIVPAGVAYVFHLILLLQLTIKVDFLCRAVVENVSLLVRCRGLELSAHIADEVAVQHLTEYQD